ncbi:MAG: hypothetical protein E7566_06695 [Ruminococcaceae bacterium]|nr:hypothetical protein [Oscillospiraceae bacterium]
MRRFFILLFILLLLIGLVGCSSSEKNDPKEVSESEKTESQVIGATEPSSVNATSSASVEETKLTSDGYVEPQPTAQVIVTIPKPTDPKKDEIKEWSLVVKGKEVSAYLPMYEGYDEPALPLLLIGKEFGAEVEWLTDTELSLWYGNDELYINTEYENFCIYLPYGIENPIREMIDEEVYIDLPSMASAIARWNGASVSVDSGNKVIRIY